MNIPLLIAIIALLIAARNIRRLNKEINDQLFDKISVWKHVDERNLRVLILEKKYDRLLGDKAQVEYDLNKARETSSLLRTELRRRHRKIVR